MASSNNTFKVNPDVIARIGKKIGARLAKDDKEFEKRIAKATQMVWAIAHQKRPLISEAQRGRWAENPRYNNYVMEGAKKRVSDPNAKAGVPVDTGALQGSITQKVSRTSKGFQGIVQTKGIKYAGFIEYGTSIMRARPFMRPAINLTKEAIKRIFGATISSNL